MNTFKQGRYSGYIKPILYLVDLSIITASIFLFEINLNNIYLFLTYASVLWFVIAFKNQFYEVNRYTKVIQIITLVLRQIVLFSVVLYAFIGFFKQPNISRLALGNYLVTVSILITSFKFLFFVLLSKYRSVLGGNLRNVIVIGDTEKTRQLIHIFNTRQDFGYKFKKQFAVKNDDFSLQKCFKYIIENEINEIYFSVAKLSNKQINITTMFRYCH